MHAALEASRQVDETVVVANMPLVCTKLAANDVTGNHAIAMIAVNESQLWEVAVEIFGANVGFIGFVTLTRIWKGAAFSHPWSNAKHYFPPLPPSPLLLSRVLALWFRRFL